MSISLLLSVVLMLSPLIKVTALSPRVSLMNGWRNDLLPTAKNKEEMVEFIAIKYSSINKFELFLEEYFSVSIR